MDEAIEHLEVTLECFRALLRVSQIEAQDRRTGMRTIDATEVLRRPWSSTSLLRKHGA